MGKSFFIQVLLAITLSNFIGCSKDDLSIEDVNKIPEDNSELKGPISGGKYYVAPWGDDNNDGSYEKPWGTWQKAFDQAQAGDVVYFRGGIYYVTQSECAMVTHNPGFHGNNGTKENPICFFNYPDEIPILDGSKRLPETWNTGINMQHSEYIHLKGLTVRNLIQPSSEQTASGIGAWECANMVFENICVYNIGGPGIFFMGGFGYDDTDFTSDSTYFINCDLHDNCDALSRGTAGAGGKADGIWAGAGYGSYIHVEGCRAWKNSDDGFDISGSTFATIKHNWAFQNGVGGGDGNGFKFGSPNEDLYDLRRVLTNNIAALNTSVGFNENLQGNYKNAYNIFNNASYSCYIGYHEQFAYLGEQKPNVYRNNLSYITTYNQAWNPGHAVFASGYVHSNNSWDTPSESSPMEITDADFVSMDPNELLLPRNKEDNSLPEINFLKPVETSKLVNAGIPVEGISYLGSAPDIGAFEVK